MKPAIAQANAKLHTEAADAHKLAAYTKDGQDSLLAQAATQHASRETVHDEDAEGEEVDVEGEAEEEAALGNHENAETAHRECARLWLAKAENASH